MQMLLRRDCNEYEFCFVVYVSVISVNIDNEFYYKLSREGNRFNQLLLSFALPGNHVRLSRRPDKGEWRKATLCGATTELGQLQGGLEEMDHGVLCTRGSESRSCYHVSFSKE